MYGTDLRFVLNVTNRAMYVSDLCFSNDNWPRQYKENEFSLRLETVLDDFQEQTGVSVRGDLVLSATINSLAGRAGQTVGWDFW